MRKAVPPVDPGTTKPSKNGSDTSEIGLVEPAVIAGISASPSSWKVVPASVEVKMRTTAAELVPLTIAEAR